MTLLRNSETSDEPILSMLLVVIINSNGWLLLHSWYVPSMVLSAFQKLTHLILLATLRDRHSHHPQFTDEVRSERVNNLHKVPQLLTGRASIQTEQPGPKAFKKLFFFS